MIGREAVILVSLSAGLIGCASTAGPAPAEQAGRVVGGLDERPEPSLRPQASSTDDDADAMPAGGLVFVEPDAGGVELISAEDGESGDLQRPEDAGGPDELNPALPSEPGPDAPFALPFPPAPENGESRPVAERTLSIDEVLASVRSTYPLLAAAFQQRGIAAGAQLEAWGEFDLKAEGSVTAQPLGFYETYRYFAGLEQPTYWGGRIFTGYRLGRGAFEPWYKERETNEAGEFTAGIAIPFAQGHDIDPRRAALWKATYGRTLTEFDIQMEGIEYTLAASMLYWEWVAAGEQVRLARALLGLARDRVDYLERQIELQRLPEIALTDNQRLIVSREARLIAAQQKLQQSAIKLSLFLREPDGTPIIPPPEWLPVELPEPEPFDPAGESEDIALALANRPELRQLTMARQQLEVDLAFARNQVEPVINGLFQGSQDVGEAVNRPDDKGPFILEAGVTVEVPLQRRKGRGKMQAAESKLAQNAANLQFTEDKIVTDVQSVNVALAAAYEQYERAVEAVELNRRLEQAELRRLELQRSDLLLVNLREQATFDAELAAVSAWLDYFQALATRRAVLAIDAALFTGQPASAGH